MSKGSMKWNLIEIRGKPNYKENKMRIFNKKGIKINILLKSLRQNIGKGNQRNI